MQSHHPAVCISPEWLYRDLEKNQSRWAPAGGKVTTRLGKIGSQGEEITPNYRSSEASRQSSST